MAILIYMYVAFVVLASFISMAVTSYVTYRKWKKVAKNNELIFCGGTLYRVIPTDILYFTTNYGWFQTKAMRNEFIQSQNHSVIVDEPTDSTKPVYNGCKVKIGEHGPIIWEVVEWVKIADNRMVLTVKETEERG